MSFSCVTLSGRLGHDPELKNAGGTKVCSIRVAISEKWKDKETTTWIQCEFWGKQAESVAQFFHKGKPIIVIGKLKQDNWEAKDGSKRSEIRVTARDFAFTDNDKTAGEQPAKGGGATFENIDF